MVAADGTSALAEMRLAELETEFRSVATCADSSRRMMAFVRIATEYLRLLNQIATQQAPAKSHRQHPLSPEVEGLLHEWIREGNVTRAVDYYCELNHCPRSTAIAWAMNIPD